MVELSNLAHKKYSKSLWISAILSEHKVNFFKQKYLSYVDAAFIL